MFSQRKAGSEIEDGDPSSFAPANLLPVRTCDLLRCFLLLSKSVNRIRPGYADNRQPLRELARRFSLQRPSNRRNDKQTAACACASRRIEGSGALAIG